ncbi:hypothetical protein FE391_26415 [Nonomuraea sp. KC401]|uniref:hypothetical protein n=1 Tax=unclassified Nonomuraea TaxID=2593643 RepID=UPI0010FE20D9|nr:MULTISPECIES: hypothetical protein [unclassified Nonomuraea]NBE94068.1 hypothetical protein [Nonomuraea sp. K271]TLF65134.1 hypothetical protein FE391_26415 [Nonomuraea sp. KC401]
MTGFTVDPWDPGYAAALAVEALSELGSTSAELVLDVERPAADWKPVTPGPDADPPRTLLVADGVRRIDARVWVHDPGSAMPVPGIAASYAAGIVRCGRDGADLAEIQVNRTLISASPDTPEVKTGHALYRPSKAADSSFEELSLALQRQVTQLEVDLAVRHRSASDDLLLVDGPLRGRTHLPRTVGYIKTHHTAYLPSPQSGVVAALAPGQRTPVFLMGTSWRRHAWYVRLPVRSAAPWAGVARCEAGADLDPAQVVRLADALTLALPPLAGVDYKDPRAPQNLVPIGGLEKLLRHHLGDSRLLYRALRNAARD